MNITVELEQITCWCGTPFMLPRRLLDSARNNVDTIYCPHGHTNVWKETEADRLRRERDRLKQQAAMLGVKEAIRAGCNAAVTDLMCSYPTCKCKHIPAAVRAVLALLPETSGRVSDKKGR